MRRRALLGIVALALAVRVYGLDFDQGHFFHPDERAIASAVLKLSFSPFRWNPEFFAYGSLPFYVTKAVTAPLAALKPWFASYDGALYTGRALSALWGAATVLLLFFFGRRLYGEKTALLASLLLALAVLPLQNAHFFASDTPLTFFVLLAVHLLGRFAEDGRPRDALLGGVAFGLALATKFSAAPLALPLVVAVLLRYRADREPYKAGFFLFLSGLAALVAFAAAQPYAFLDFPRFSHDVLEQSRMVRQAGLFAFTNQYVGTPKLLYPLSEMAFWGLGPLLFLAAVTGTLLAAFRFRRASPGALVALAWVVPYAAVTCSFDVKFPRYLLPVYPFLILWGAKALTDAAERGLRGRLARAAVVSGTAVYALFFLSIYSRPHTIVTASRWFYAHVPAGAKIVSQDWDEGFPFPLPGLSPDRYRITNFGWYEEDSPEKIARLARELAEADGVVLQTKRLYGAVTRAPAKFPLTTSAFRLLFSGDLGFVLAKDVVSRPGLFGITLPDELADESFTVYDHPKWLWFENRGHLSAEEIERRILSGKATRAVSRRDMLLATAGAPAGAAEAPAAPRKDEARGGFASTLLLVLLVEALAISAWALLASIVPSRPGLWALSKGAGVLLFGYVPWLLSSLGLAPFARPALLGTAAALVLLGGWLFRKRGLSIPEDAWRTEAIAGAVFLFFLAARLLNPEIFWGEKPMDFSFLNALYRTTVLPPPEPWFSGTPLSYTYFGSYLVAAFGKALGIAPGVMFNLGIPLAAALTATSVYAAGTFLAGARAGLFGVLLALAAGNLAAPFLAIHRRAGLWEIFWDSSRVIPAGINEYPLWTFLFADLHAHALVMPFTAGFTALLVLFLTRRHAGAAVFSPTRAAGWSLFSGLFLGAVQVTNGWSIPTYLALLFFLLVISWWTGRGGGFVAAIAGLVRGVALPAAGTLFFAWLLYRPFWRSFTRMPPNFGWEPGPYARPLEFLEIWGFFLALVIPFLFLAFRRSLVASPSSGRLGRGQRVAFLLLAALLAFSLAFRAGSSAAAPVRTFGTALFAFALLVALRKETADEDRLPAALAAFSFAIFAGVETVHVWDRMNTVFKFYLEAWIFLSLAGGAALVRLLAPEPFPGKRLWRAAAAVAGTLALFTSAVATVGALSVNRVDGPRGTLDGTAYERRYSPEEKAAYDWLNRTVPGIPVLAEAWGPSYQDFARVSMNTGLPIVVGWDYHVTQRGHARADVERRKADVATLYGSPDRAAVEAVLKRYHVALVWVSALEQKTYGGDPAARFREWKDLLTPVYENPGVTIFAVKGNFRGDASATIEQVEPPPGAPAEGASEPAPAQDPLGKVGQPRAAAVDAKGNIYVADFVNNRIQKFGPDLQPLLAWGRRGSRPGEFKDPCGIAIGPSGEVFVADTWNSRIQVFSPEGKFLREWNHGFFGPRGVAVDRSGTVFVADTGNGRIVRSTADGRKEAEWGTRGEGPGQLSEPQGVAVDGKGRVYVCDNNNARLDVFDRDGALLKAIPVPGWRREVFSEPYAAVDAAGTIWVTVPRESEIRAFAPDGTLKTVLKGGVGDVKWDKPVGIALLSGKRLLVTDIENRILVVPKP